MQNRIYPILILIAVILTSCFQGMTPQKVLTASNQAAKVELLFEVDGCKVYRFFDGGIARYFTKCESCNSSSVGWSESCGKNCVRTVENQTNYVNDSTKLNPIKK